MVQGGPPLGEPTLNLLLVEDNPGDARLIREMIASSAGWDRRLEGIADLVPDVGPEGSGDRPGEATVERVDRLEAGLDALDADHVDIVLLDLNLPDSRGLDTLDAVVEHAPDVPVVVLTGMADQNLGLRALDHGAQEYLVKDEVNGDMLVRTVFHAIQRQRFEREIDRQHQRLATLNEIGLLLQAIAGSLIDLGTTEEIESTVCSRLADSAVYTAAWIGELDQAADAVVPRTAAVPAGFLDGQTVSLDGGDGVPVDTAIADNAVGVVTQATESPAYGDWREHAATFGYRSMAAVPIRYNDVLHGLLFIYTDRPSAFGDEEHGMVAQLGNVIGHAINAVAQRAALMGDPVHEIELSLPGILQGGLDDGAEVSFLTTVPANDGTYLQYAEATEVGEDELTEVMAQFDSFRGLRPIEESGERRLFEIRYSDPPIISQLASFGGRFRSASLVGRDYRVTVEIPSDIDVRAFVDAMRDAYPEVDLIAQRSVGTGGDDEGRGRPAVRELTEKQRAVLEAAYFSGYFDRPRRSTGEDIAGSLDISPSTLHQHLQVGLRKVLATEFEGGRTGTDRTVSHAAPGDPAVED